MFETTKVNLRIKTSRLSVGQNTREFPQNSEPRQFGCRPAEVHWEAARRILAHLRDTKELKPTDSRGVEVPPLKTHFAEKAGLWGKTKKTLPTLGFGGSTWGDNKNS